LLSGLTNFRPSKNRVLGAINHIFLQILTILMVFLLLLLDVKLFLDFDAVTVALLSISFIKA